MMIRGRAVTAAVTCLMMVGFFSIACYSQEQKDRNVGQNWGRPTLVDALKLTPEQEKEIDVQRLESMRKQREFRRRLVENKEKLFTELKKKKIDMKKISAQVTEFKDIQSDMTDDRIDNFLAMKKVLTQEQFEKLLDYQGDGSGGTGS